MTGEGMRGSKGEEHAGDPRCEEEVDANRVVVLTTNSFKVEKTFEGVGEGDREEEGEGEEPDGEVDGTGNVEEGSGGAGGESPPKYGLAAKAEAYAEGVDGEAEEEGPELVFWEEKVLRVLQIASKFQMDN